MNQRGFTLIETMVVVFFALTVILMTVSITGNITSGAGNTISYGYNGLTESRCIDGYKFIVSQDGGARQIMDELGRGVKCQ